jgi:hypothetical protein
MPTTLWAVIYFSTVAWFSRIENPVIAAMISRVLIESFFDHVAEYPKTGEATERDSLEKDRLVVVSGHDLEALRSAGSGFRA